MARAWVVDDEGFPVVWRVKGYDLSNPEAIHPIQIEMRAGGQLVGFQMDNKPITVAPDPLPPPTEAEVGRERAERAKATEQLEEDARKAEREAGEAKARTRAARTAS